MAPPFWAAKRERTLERAITGFHQDEEGDWVAELDCGHGQHVRHQPPFFNRPWTSSEAGRRSKLGEVLNCKRCDDFEIPDGFVEYKRTKIFDQESIPAGLQRAHTTKRGVWGRIHCRSGRLTYVVEPPLQARFELGPDRPGIVVPEVRHWVSPEGTVSFFVAFFKKP